jgi:CDP-diglyceride synthetase
MREVSVKDSTPKVLAALAVLLFIALIAFVAAGLKPDETMRDGFWLLAGAAIATFKDVYGYYFGSSSGSHGKDETINAMAGKT